MKCCQALGYLTFTLPTMIRHIPCPTGNGYFKIQDFMKLGFGLDRREMTSSGDDQSGRSIFHFTSFSALRLAGKSLSTC